MSPHEVTKILPQQVPASPASKQMKIELNINTSRDELASPISNGLTDGETSPLSPIARHDAARLLT